MITYEGKMSKIEYQTGKFRKKRFTNLKNQNSVSGQGEIVLQLYNKGSKSLSNIIVSICVPMPLGTLCTISEPKIFYNLYFGL